MIRRFLRGLFGDERGRGAVVHIVGDPFDTETNPRRRQESARKLMEQHKKLMESK